MNLQIEKKFKNRDIDEISARLGLPKNMVRRILNNVTKYFKYPESIDSDHALVCAYCDTYRKKGEEAARQEVARRIRLANEIRKLRSLAMESGRLTNFYNVDDTNSLGSFM